MQAKYHSGHHTVLHYLTYSNRYLCVLKHLLQLIHNSRRELSSVPSQSLILDSQMNAVSVSSGGELVWVAAPPQ
jgi:hypothetical protein